MVKFTAKNKLVAGFSLAIAAVLTCGAAGTVAWFTANRNVSLNYSKVTVTSAASDLKIGYIPLENAIPGEKTAVNGDLVVTGDTKLTDASGFKGTAIYRPLWGGNSFNMEAVKYHIDGVEQYYFSTFMVELENSGESSVNVFFDGGNSHIKDVDTDEYVVSDFTRVSLSKPRSDKTKPTSFITEDQFKLMFMDTDPTPIKDEGKWADYTVSGASHKKYNDYLFTAGNPKTGVKTQVTDPDGKLNPTFVSAVTRNAEEMSGWTEASSSGAWTVSFASDIPAGNYSIEYVYTDSEGADAYGETDVIVESSAVPAGTPIDVTPKGSDVIKSIHTVYHHDQKAVKLLTTDYKQIVDEKGDLYVTINKQLSVHEDVAVQFEAIDYVRKYTETASFTAPIEAAETKTISPATGVELVDVAFIKVDGVAYTDFTADKVGDDLVVTFNTKIESGEVVVTYNCKSGELIDIDENDYYRDVNAEDSPLIVTPASTASSENWLCELAKKEKTYIVVTMWFEGTELAVQNQFLEQMFDLKLAFASMEVEA